MLKIQIWAIKKTKKKKKKEKRIKQFQEFRSWKYFADETIQSSLGKQFRTNHTIACITVSVCTAHLFQMVIIWSSLQCVVLPCLKAAINFLNNVVLISKPNLWDPSFFNRPYTGEGVEQSPGLRGVLCWQGSGSLCCSYLSLWCSRGNRMGRPQPHSCPTAAVLNQELK